jgi:hypothetical protein
MAHGDAREGKWRGNWRMEWVAITLHTTSEHGVSSITTADAHTSAASSRLNWRPRRFKWTRPFRRKTKYGFCACAITFQLASTNSRPILILEYLLSSTPFDHRLPRHQQCNTPYFSWNLWAYGEPWTIKKFNDYITKRPVSVHSFYRNIFTLY